VNRVFVLPAVALLLVVLSIALLIGKGELLVGFNWAAPIRAMLGQTIPRKEEALGTPLSRTFLLNLITYIPY
jgi:hypothetical protein